MPDPSHPPRNPPVPTPYYATPKQPRLIWNDRDKRKAAEPLPTQTVEIIRPFYADKMQGGLDMAHEVAPESRLIWTNDNLVALTSLLHGDGNHAPLEGKVDLIYIDPPFAVQSDFKINVEIENGLSDEKLPTLIEEIAYKDTWKDGLDSYLSMMRDRLELLKRLLSPTGSICVHCDYHAGHYIKVMMDEVFGYENFRNEIILKRPITKNLQRQFETLQALPQGHDTVFLYSKQPTTRYAPMFFEFENKKPEGYWHHFWSNADRPTMRYEILGVTPNSGQWKLEKNRAMKAVSNYETYLKESKGLSLVEYWEKTGRELQFIRKNEKTGKIENWFSPANERIADTLWTEVKAYENEKLYPTQKNVQLLQTIINFTTSANDLILDCFSGSGTTAVAAETMKDAEGKAAPRRWIAIDNGKFAIHLTRKRLIEANARPFAVENVGFYARNEPWQDKYQNSPSAKLYRDAMVEVYGGAPVEGFTYLHGKKGSRWVHVGPMNAPVVESQLECIVKEAAASDTRSVDVLSADVDIDFNKGEIEAKYGVSVQAKIIPQVAIEAVRERLKRKRAKDARLEAAPDIHFFSPPDIEVRALASGGGVTVTLTRLTVDLDDCLSTQDAAKRAEIKNRITDWKALVDYWAVDWDYDGQTFRNDWQTFRTRKSREIAPQAAHTYAEGKGDKRIAVKVTDIFGNDGLKVIRVIV